MRRKSTSIFRFTDTAGFIYIYPIISQSYSKCNQKSLKPDRIDPANHKFCPKNLNRASKCTFTMDKSKGTYLWSQCTLWLPASTTKGTACLWAASATMFSPIGAITPPLAITAWAPTMTFHHKIILNTWLTYNWTVERKMTKKKIESSSITMFTREIMAKIAESVINVVCRPLATNSFARRCPWYLSQHHSKEYKQNS